MNTKPIGAAARAMLDEIKRLEDEADRLNQTIVDLKMDLVTERVRNARLEEVISQYATAAGMTFTW
jgi:hypothetical protein